MTDREAILSAIAYLQRHDRHIQLLKDTGTQKNPIVEDILQDMIPGVIDILKFTLDYYMENIHKFDDPDGVILGTSKATQLAYTIIGHKEKK